MTQALPPFGRGLTLFCPAKINLLLAVTGRRPDGFHELVSLACPLAFGDQLWLLPPRDGADADLEISGPAAAGVPRDSGNLVLRARALFEAATGISMPVRFHLFKRIPAEAGLGGGSSNGAAALRLLNRAAGNPLAATELRELAGELGSDCALFLHAGPAVMRGRGEQTEAVRPRWWDAGAPRMRMLLFKPAFGVGTAWAYASMADRGDAYLDHATAEQQLTALLESSELDPGHPVNNMESVVFSKFMAFNALFDLLQAVSGASPRLCGSGSTCFLLLGPDSPVARLRARIEEAWGPGRFIVETGFHTA